MIISIDGPAGSGKSTVASILAKKLGFIHFNSGSLYRAITAYLIANNVDVKNLSNSSLIKDLKLEVKFLFDEQHVFVNDIDYTNDLRNTTVSTLTPIVSIQPKVRSIVDNAQRKIAELYNLVVDGRDIGSYVFPNAEIKFYLDSDITERARRRKKELKNESLTLKEIEKMLLERDTFDKNKKIAPLVIPNGAIIIDSTNLSIDEVVDEMLKHIKIEK